MQRPEPVSRFLHMIRNGARRVFFPGRLAIPFVVLFPLQSNAQAPALEVIDSQDPPWPSIGRVNVAGYNRRSMCTGTLVAPRMVLTAAHCLFDLRKRKPLPVDDVLFIAGLRRDQYAERLEAECYLTGKDYRAIRKPELKELHEDVGIIVLKAPSRLPPVPALSAKDTADIKNQTLFRSVGYRRSRSFLPTAVRNCRIVAVREGIWITNCPTESGASGGPLLLETPDGPRVAAITTAMLDDSRSAVVPVHRWRDLLEHATCEAASDKDADMTQDHIENR